MKRRPRVLVAVCGAALAVAGCQSSAARHTPSPLAPTGAAAAAAGAAADSAGPAATPVRDSLGLLVPARVGRYRLQRVEGTAGGASEGTVYRFSAGSATRVTVFVYPVPADVRRGDVPQDWVTAEAAKFQETLPVAVQRGWYDQYTLAFAHPEPVVADTLGIPGHATAVVTRTRGRIGIELQYLYLVRGAFLKVRATVPERGWTQTDVPVFAKQLALAAAQS